MNLFEKNLLFWSWLCKHQDEEICSLGRWIFYQGSKKEKIKTDSWDLLETNNNSPLLKRIWFLHLRFVARSRNLEQVIDCCFLGKSHLFSRQLSHCNFFGKLLTQRPIGYKTQWFDQKSLWQKRETIRGYFVLWQGNFCVLSLAKRKWCWKYLRLWQLLKRRCGDIVQSLSITSEPALTSWQMKVIQLWNFFNISSILCFSHPNMKDPFKHFVNISAIAKIFCKKKKSLLQAQSNRINHGNKERKYVSEGIKIRGVSDRHCLLRYENKEERSSEE